MRIAVIGAGVVGSLIARELARYDAEILLFDREVEAGFGGYQGQFRDHPRRIPRRARNSPCTVLRFGERPLSGTCGRARVCLLPHRRSGFGL